MSAPDRAGTRRRARPSGRGPSPWRRPCRRRSSAPARPLPRARAAVSWCRIATAGCRAARSITAASMPQRSASLTIQPFIHGGRCSTSFIEQMRLASASIGRPLSSRMYCGPGERHVHRPDEDGAERSSSACRSPGSCHRPAPIHMSRTRSLRWPRRRPGRPARCDLVAEPARMRDRPVRAAMPLRDHRVGHLVGDRHRAGPRLADQRAPPPQCSASCSLIAVHQRVELVLVEAAAGLALEQRDEVAHLLDQQGDAVAAGRPLPSRCSSAVNHSGSLCSQPGASIGEEVRAQRLGPLREHVLDAVAGEPRDQHRRLRQAAPGRGRRIVGQRAGQAERAVRQLLAG